MCDAFETGCSEKQEGVTFMTYMDLNQYIGTEVKVKLHLLSKSVSAIWQRSFKVVDWGNGIK